MKRIDNIDLTGRQIQHYRIRKPVFTSPLYRVAKRFKRFRSNEVGEIHKGDWVQFLVRDTAEWHLTSNRKAALIDIYVNGDFRARIPLSFVDRMFKKIFALVQVEFTEPVHLFGLNNIEWEKKEAAEDLEELPFTDDDLLKEM